MRNGEAIAAARGGRTIKNGWTFCCPCHDDREASAAIRDDGLITCFAGCARSDVMAALDGLGFTDDDERTTNNHAEDTTKRIRLAQNQWSLAEGIAGILQNGDFIARYLRSRGITLPVPAALRLWDMSEIIAAVQQLDGSVTAVHLKRTTKDRRRIKSITRGWMGGGAVQLAPPCDGELGLAEGFENALSATQMFGVPCWATLSANRLSAIDLPSSVRRVHLFADNDDGGASRRNIKLAKQRYSNRLLHVRTWWPPDGQDWNDVLKGKP